MFFLNQAPTAPPNKTEHEQPRRVSPHACDDSLQVGSNGSPIPFGCRDIEYLPLIGWGGAAAGVGWCGLVLWCAVSQKEKKQTKKPAGWPLSQEISNSNDGLLESCNFGSCIHWRHFDEVQMLSWYRFWKVITSISHCSFPSSLPKILQHIIAAEEVIHRYMHALTEYLFSLVSHIFKNFS